MVRPIIPENNIGDKQVSDKNWYVAVCIVLELMDGGSLQNIIDNKLKLNEHDLAIVAYSITRALSELHKRNIVHRDIKVIFYLICFINRCVICIELIAWKHSL